MIADHLGRADWGAIIDLGDTELAQDFYFIQLVDYLSAKFGNINVALLEQKEG